MSRSFFRTTFSRRIRFSSACRSTAASLGSLASRSCLTQRVSLDFRLTQLCVGSAVGILRLFQASDLRR